MIIKIPFYFEVDLTDFGHLPAEDLGELIESVKIRIPKTYFKVINQLEMKFLKKKIVFIGITREQALKILESPDKLKTSFSPKQIEKLEREGKTLGKKLRD